MGPLYLEVEGDHVSCQVFVFRRVVAYVSRIGVQVYHGGDHHLIPHVTHDFRFDKLAPPVFLAVRKSPRVPRGAPVCPGVLRGHPGAPRGRVPRGAPGAAGVPLRNNFLRVLST